VSIDLGEGRSLVLNYYSLHHGNSAGYCRLQSWDFEGSNDGSKFTVLKAHKNDNSLPDRGFSVAAWEIKDAKQAYRYFRIRMTGKHSNEGWGSHENDYCLFCFGIELYGMLLGR
jgi:hypothetical protein